MFSIGCARIAGVSNKEDFLFLEKIMKYVLDLSNVKNANSKHGNETLKIIKEKLNSKIIIEDGKHDRKYEVVESLIDQSIVDELREILYSVYGEGYKQVNFPIGIDSIPVGAKLIEIN